MYNYIFKNKMSSNSSLLLNNKNYLLQSLLQNFLKRLNVKFICK